MCCLAELGVERQGGEASSKRIDCMVDVCRARACDTTWHACCILEQARSPDMQSSHRVQSKHPGLSNTAQAKVRPLSNLCAACIATFRRCSAAANTSCLPHLRQHLPVKCQDHMSPENRRNSSETVLSSEEQSRPALRQLMQLPNKREACCMPASEPAVQHK